MADGTVSSEMSLPGRVGSERDRLVSQDSLGSSGSTRRNSYVQANGDPEDMLEWQYLPFRRSDGDLLTGGWGPANGRRNSYSSAMSTPVLGHWSSTGSMVLELQLEKEVTNSTVQEEEDDNSERGTWDSPAEFILSCLGYAVGLGNVWRFPYMAYTNGGGAFLIPYTLMLTFIGIPVFLMELGAGQYSASGPVHVFNCAPLFQGIGVGMVITIWGGIYYQMIITWSLYYLFASFQKNLPWKGCHHDFNTAYCYSKEEAMDCETVQNGKWFNQTCYNQTYVESFDELRTACNTTNLATASNITDTASTCYNYTYNSLSDYLNNNLTKRLVSPTEEYFNFGMLKRSDNIEDTGTIQWDIALTYLLAWILCYLCILKGIKSSGKVVYFTATFPYLLLVILFFRAVTLPGAGKGIYFYIVPKWEQLLNAKVWADAAGQIFFSLSVGGGGLMTFASYNKFHNNIYRDTMIVAIGNCLTSVFAGFVIFSILGFMATELNVEVPEVAKSGSGLAFIAYPEVVTRLPVPQLWAALFFFMLLTLGLDSMFAGLENTQTAIVDVFPRLRKYKPLVALSICVFCFLLGLTQCTNSGVYWTELCAYYNAGWAVLLMGMAEAMVFAWVYGSRRLLNDIQLMVGFRLYPHWWICWTFITPVVLVVIFFVNVIKFTPLSYGDYELPSWAQSLGWLMAVNGVLMIPIVMVWRIVRTYRDTGFAGLTLSQRILKLMKPSPQWTANMIKNVARDNQNVNNSGPASVAPSAGHSRPPPPYSVTTQPYENPAYVKE